MKNILAITLLGSCALLIGACSTDLQKSQAAPQPIGNEFTRDLSNYYRGMGPNQWDGQRDFQASEHFSRKSMAAGRGEVVMPDLVVHNQPIRLEPELVAARARLINAFNAGSTTRVPNASARAQIYFDCWLDEAKDPVQGVPGAWLDAKVQNCRNGYYSAMTEIETVSTATTTTTATTQTAVVQPAPARQQAYITFFDFDQSTVTPQGLVILKGVAENVRRGGATDVTVTGNADRSGADGYNLALSERRAAAVKAVLVRDGVSPSVIVTLARGESVNLLPTADGVREPQNRNVAVYIR